MTGSGTLSTVRLRCSSSTWPLGGSEESKEKVFIPMTNKNLSIARHDPGISIVEIDRPKFLNALNTETLQELKAALAELARDETCRVVVLTGSGEKSFIAGADIAEMKDKSVPDGT